MISVFGRLYPTIPDELGTCPACTRAGREPGTLRWNEKAQTKADYKPQTLRFKGQDAQDARPARSWVCDAVFSEKVLKTDKHGRASTSVRRRPCGYAMRLSAVFDVPDVEQRLAAGCDPSILPLTLPSLMDALTRLKENGHVVFPWLTNEKDIAVRIRGHQGDARDADGRDKHGMRFNDWRALMSETPLGAPIRLPLGATPGRDVVAGDREVEQVRADAQLRRAIEAERRRAWLAKNGLDRNVKD